MRIGNESTNICGTAKIKCYMQAHQSLFEEDIVDGLTDQEAKTFRRECNCLPSCTTIMYDVHVDRAKFYWREALLRTLNWTTEEVYRSFIPHDFLNIFLKDIKKESFLT